MTDEKQPTVVRLFVVLLLFVFSSLILAVYQTGSVENVCLAAIIINP